jgi:hypothetical protein
VKKSRQRTDDATDFGTGKKEKEKKRPDTHVKIPVLRVWLPLQLLPIDPRILVASSAGGFSDPRATP